MNKTFGTKENVVYFDRKGAYIIPVRDRKIAVVKTPKGYFLLGGGMENDETDVECIRRECLEEIGYTVGNLQYICSAETYGRHPKLGYFHPIQKYYYGELLEQTSEPQEADHCLMWVDYDELKGNMFSEMQDWALEECWKWRNGRK